MITPWYLESSGRGPPLEVAVLLDSHEVPRYVAAILEDIAACNFARVSLCLSVGPAAARFARDLPELAQDLYERVDRAVAGEDDPLTTVGAEPWLDGVDVIELPRSRGGVIELDAAALAEVEQRRVDVILRFSAAAPRGRLLDIPRAGVWSYHFGADEHPRGELPYLRAIAEGAVTLDAQLERLADAPEDRVVLCRSTFSAQGSVFVAHQRQVPIWESTHFVLWKLRDLHERGWDYLVRRAAQSSPSALETTRTDLASFLVPRFAEGVKRRLTPQPAELVHRWRIALRRADRPLSDAPGAADARDFHWLQAPAGHYWADPFLFEHQGKLWLFCEDYLYDRRFAGISRAEVLPDGSLGPMEMCLDPGFHLSFPHVFTHEGEVFMIPESLSNGTVTLYRARRFPDVWVQEKVLFQGNAADTALLVDGGRFHFFTTLFDRDDRGMKTILFVADTLTGAWRMHPDNPVSSDVRASRSAGAVCTRGGRRLRPVQNCGPRYGYGFLLQEIVRLDEDRFEERPFCWLDPSGLGVPARGVHTYNQGGGFEVIDSFTVGPRPT